MAITTAVAESINSGVGYTVTILGAFVSAPDGTRRHGARIKSLALGLLVLLHLRTPADPKVRIFHLSAGVPIHWNDHAEPTLGEGPIENRVRDLERRADAADSRAAALAADLRAEAQDRTAAVEELARQIRQQRHEITIEFQHRDQESSRVDANGIPVVVAGTILTTSATWLAAHPHLPFALVWPVAALGLCGWGIYVVFWRHRPSSVV